MIRLGNLYELIFSYGHTSCYVEERRGHTETVPRPSTSTRILSTLFPLPLPFLLPSPTPSPGPLLFHIRSKTDLDIPCSKGLPISSSSSYIASRAGLSSNRSSGKSEAENNHQYIFFSGDQIDRH